MNYLAIIAATLSIARGQDLLPSLEATDAALNCLESMVVPHKKPSHADYAKLVKPFNSRLQYKPAVVVLPTTEQHIQDSVLCAAQTGLKVQARCGGHSYASYSSGGQDGHMIINLQPLQTIEVDKLSGIATVGGGVRLGNLAGGLWNQGKRVLSHGTCPGVGIGGHFTHGGYSYTSRHYGLAMDQIIAMDVVLANGTLVKATSDECPEIFWAMRGAGDAFGIVTKFYLQTHPAPPSVVHFTYDFEGIFKSKDKFRDIFLHLQDVAMNASVMDDKSNYQFYLDGNGTYSVSGIYFGSVDEYNNKLKDELLRTLPPSKATVKSMSWIDFLVEVSRADSLKTDPTGYDQHVNFFAKSVSVPEKDGVSAESMNALYDHLQTAGDVHYWIEIYLHGGPGSNINNKDTSFAAYTDRDNLWVFQNYGFEEKSMPFINGINDAIIKAQPQTQFGAYLNYVDPTYDAATAHKIYYGDAVHSKLEELKERVDPQRVFWHPQAIGA